MKFNNNSIIFNSLKICNVIFCLMSTLVQSAVVIFQILLVAISHNGKIHRFFKKTRIYNT